jgi:hypothetical protein
LIVAQLDQTEAQVAAIINDSSQSDFEKQLEKASRRYPSKDKDGEQRPGEDKD